MAPDAGWAYGSQSFSTYLFGSMVALLNEELLAAGKSSLGFLNPFIYQNLDAFNDFTTGLSCFTIRLQFNGICFLNCVFSCSGNNPGCDVEGFNATTGWDPVRVCFQFDIMLYSFG